MDRHTFKIESREQAQRLIDGTMSIKELAEVRARNGLPPLAPAGGARVYLAAVIEAWDIWIEIPELYKVSKAVEEARQYLIDAQ